MDTTIRTTEEIVAYCRECHNSPSFSNGYILDILLLYLPIERVQEFLIPKAYQDWHPIPLSRANILREMQHYMEFGWEKVSDHRSISANRTIVKMGAWLWLLKDDEIRDFVLDEEHYAQYGAPALKKICEAYSFPIPDDPRIERMAQSLPCWDECYEGCNE